MGQEVQSFIRTYGYDGFHYGKRIAVLSDTTYLIMGNKSGTGGQNNVYLIHVDKKGQIIKDNVFGGSQLYYGTDMIVVGDTAIYVCGYVLRSFGYEYDNFVIRVNMNLELEFTYGYAYLGWDLTYGIVADRKGMKYIISQIPVVYSKPSVQIQKYQEGLFLPENRFFGNDSLEHTPTAIVLSGDSILYISGYCETDSGFAKGFILKMDTMFNFIDTLYLFRDSSFVEILDIDTTHYGGITFTGKATGLNDNSRRFLYGITDQNLNLIYFEWGYHPNDWCNCIKTAPFSDYTVFAGYTSSAGSGGADFHYQLFDGSVASLSSTIGGLMYDEAFDCAFALDSTIVLVGTSQSFGLTQTSIMFAKTCKNYYYCVPDHQHYLQIEEQAITNPNILIYPVPASMFINVSINEPLPVGNIAFELISMSGASVQCDYLNTQTQTYVVSIPKLPAGMYVLRLTKGFWSSSQKIIISQ